MHNSATKQLSIDKYRNSEDSSLTPNSTPPLTGNIAMGHQANPRSSVDQAMSISNPTQEKEEENSDEGFNPPITAAPIERGE